MKVIALDATGGDFSPRAPVEAAARASLKGQFKVLLVGDPKSLEAALSRFSHNAACLEILPANGGVAMGENPVDGLKANPEAGILVAMKSLVDGRAEALVSAGHSGATVVAGKLTLGTLKGIQRPAIATHLPHRRGTSILLDSGANVDCRPQFLAQFALMGQTYATCVLGVEKPNVALLSNGAEPGKGNELTRQVFALLEDSVKEFTGNLEPRDLFRGRADVIVCDGFVGNLVLKTAEAAGMTLRLLLKDSLSRSWLTKLGGLLTRGLLNEVVKRVDYREVGGSLLLGLKAPVVVAHGSSGVTALENALSLAHTCAEKNLCLALQNKTNIKKNTQ